jgi:L-threonylcarbamoyladenylate synthase
VNAEVERAVAAIRAGRLAVIPTDTVYGLACAPDDGGAVAVLSTLKQRSQDQPIALLASSIDVLFERLPELDEDGRAVARALLPGPYTLVVGDPARRFALLSGSAVETVGVRVPAVAGVAFAILEAVGAVAATSANLHGDPDPRSLDDVPAEIRVACATVDGGVLPGTPSTVIDLTVSEPRVVREGAVASDEALALIAATLGR